MLKIQKQKLSSKCPEAADKTLSKPFKMLIKVVMYLTKKKKSLLLHCDITDGISLFTHDTKHYPKYMEESIAQAINLI